MARWNDIALHHTAVLQHGPGMIVLVYIIPVCTRTCTYKCIIHRDVHVHVCLQDLWFRCFCLLLLCHWVCGCGYMYVCCVFVYNMYMYIRLYVPLCALCVYMYTCVVLCTVFYACVYDNI